MFYHPTCGDRLLSIATKSTAPLLATGGAARGWLVTGAVLYRREEVVGVASRSQVYILCFCFCYLSTFLMFFNIILLLFIVSYCIFVFLNKSRYQRGETPQQVSLMALYETDFVGW